MKKKSSSQLMAIAAQSGPQSVAKISQNDQKKTVNSNEYVFRTIGWILRGGVILSASIILIGLLLLLTQEQQNFSMIMSIGAFPHSLNQVLTGLKVLQPQAIIVTGLLLLIATPVLSVTTSLVVFAVERDRRFVVITSVVLAILLTSVLIGKGG